MKTISYKPFRYHGNIIIFILGCLVIHLPFIIALLIKNGEYSTAEKSYRAWYSGSYNWLCFWAFIFFPVMIVLLIINGIGVTEFSYDTDESKPVIVVKK